jgi:hypothetical protein
MTITSRRSNVSAVVGIRFSDSFISSLLITVLSVALTSIGDAALGTAASSPCLLTKACFLASSNDLNERLTVEWEKVSSLNFARVDLAAPR